MKANPKEARPSSDKSQAWRSRMHEVIFEADTPAGKAFDVALLVLILLSIIVVMLDSVATIHEDYDRLLTFAEWTITILFTVEYIARLSCLLRPWRYARSFYGVVDLLAVLPAYLGLVVVGSQSLVVFRAFRLIRIFRVFKLTHYLNEVESLVTAIRNTRRRIAVFMVFILTLILIFGSTMYLIEGGQEGTTFTSIPRSVYWAIVTMTTVGYGDIAPQTNVGQALAAVVMILGYAIIIVPIGVFSAEIVVNQGREISTQACPSCAAEGHDFDAKYCKFCGMKL